MSAGTPGRTRPATGAALTVELVGIPGCGKSRRARTLAERLADRGIPVVLPQAAFAPSVPTRRRLTRKALACGTTALIEPGTAARVAGSIARSGQPGPGQATGRIVQWLVAEHVAVRSARRAGVSLVDEGLVQALWSIGLRGDVRPVLAALDAAPPRAVADLLVVVRVPAELALARLAARSSRHSRTQLLDEPGRRAELERGARLLDDLIAWWSSWAPAPREVLTLDGTEDDGSDHRQLVDRICAAPAAGARPA